MRPLLLLAALLSLAGCKASVSANVNAGGSSDKSDPVPPPSQDATAHREITRTSFIGVTHALELSEEASARATCQCMAAAVGAPGDGAFQWRGTPPAVGDDALVIAIGNEKSSCSGQGTFRGPSIQGVEIDGNNVIVHLEEPRPGVPVARGAVFRRPPGEGFLVFRPGRRLPYGQPLPGSGSSVCRLPLGENAAAHPADATTAPARRGPNPPVNTY